MFKPVFEWKQIGRTVFLVESNRDGNSGMWCCWRGFAQGPPPPLLLSAHKKLTKYHLLVAFPPGLHKEAGLRASKPIKQFLWSRESPDVIWPVWSENPPGENPLDVPVLLSYKSSDITFVAT